MFFIKSIILFVHLMPSITGENANINCPRFCKCDLHLKLNRAQCSAKNLINAEIDLPGQVQILDLSYNDITEVDNKCFTNFFHLKYLNLSHNALHAIDWNAFSKLKRLLEINLSYNRLEYLDEKWFVKNKFLNKLNLEGNKLESLQDKPLLNNPLLKELNLKNSHINSLQPQFFAKLTNLQHLDLSKNSLNNFNIEDFQHLPKLQQLNLNENFIKCDDITRNKLKQLKKKGIHVTMDDCLKESHGKSKLDEKMFEKMIMATQKTTKEDESEWHLNLDLEEPAIDNELDSKEILGPTTSINGCNKQNFILCQEYQSCLHNLNEASQERHNNKDQSSLNDIKFAFALGIAIGASLIVIILACALCIKHCYEIKKKAPPTDNMDNLSSQPLAHSITQIPVQIRRQSRRRTTHLPRSMVRYEGPVTENFISRLFGRPARQQYYRAINQNTVTLIRHLSRSNLFNNHLSQHIDRQLCTESSSPEIYVPIPRPETPPPSYGDIVIKNSNGYK